MRPYYTNAEFMNAAQHQRAELVNVLNTASHYSHVHQQKRAELGRSYAQAAFDLGASLLPEMSDPAVRRAAELSGYARIVAENPVGAMEAERQALTARVSVIDADPRFAQRELLRHPNTGSLTRGVREIEEYRAPFARILALAEHPRIERLVECGYDTPAYVVGFWRMSYYEDWKAGDEITERFPDKKFFSEVRAEYIRAREAIGPLDSEWQRLKAEIAAGQALENEHAERSRALSTLTERWLTHLRGRLVTFMTECPQEALAPRLAGAPDVELLFKRVNGLIHKARYLDQMVGHDVEATRASAAQTIAKLDKDIAKFSRPKYAYQQVPGPVFEKRFRDRRPAYQKRWQRFERSYSTVYAYDHYHHARLGSDLLWWDLMTDGRIDGDYIDEVRMYRTHHPHYQYRSPDRDLEDDRELRAAAAEHEREALHQERPDTAFDAS